MPSKYVVREFAENEIYHLFNRGVEKRKIFLDKKDYKIFIYYLSVYLLPITIDSTSHFNMPIRLQTKNLANEVDLISYCLMPNHFHLLAKQTTRNGIAKLMKQLTNAYTFYFNDRYKRVGGLMQGRYKAVRIETDDQLTHVSRYIHLNPIAASIVKSPEDYKWSNYKEYFNKRSENLTKTEYILSHFSSPKDYGAFVQDHASYLNSLSLVDSKLIDSAD